MSSSILRSLNSTNIPLLANGIFLGQAEFAGSLLTVLVNCYADTEIKVEIFEYSTPALTVAVPISITTIPALTYQQIEANINFPYVKLVVTNMAATNQNQLNINTVYTNLLPLGAGLLDLSGNVSVSVDGVVDVSGNVVVSNLITETLATTPVSILTIGQFYRVASVGLTTGAEWAAVGAIIGGESIPSIGRLFKALAVAPNIGGQGTCYSVEYTDDVSANVTNLITETLATTPVSILTIGQFYRVASVGLTTGAEWAAVGAIIGGESIPSIGRLFKALAVAPNIGGQGTCYSVEYTDDVNATITNFPATQVVSGTVSLTNPTTVRISDYYGDPILTTAGQLMVGIGNIYTANPLHVIVDSVTPPTTSVAGALAVSTTGITLKASSGKLLTLHINSDGALGTNYVKIYNVAVPTSADTPIFTIGVLYGSSQNVDCASLNFTTAIGVRATTAAAAGDNTPPTNTINVTAFFV